MCRARRGLSCFMHAAHVWTMQTSISPGTVRPATAGRRPQLQRKERDVSDVASASGAFSRVVRGGCTGTYLVSFCRSGRVFAPDDNFSVCFWPMGEISGFHRSSNPAVLFFQHPNDANRTHRNILTTCNLAQLCPAHLQKPVCHGAYCLSAALFMRMLVVRSASRAQQRCLACATLVRMQAVWGVSRAAWQPA